MRNAAKTEDAREIVGTSTYGNFTMVDYCSQIMFLQILAYTLTHEQRVRDISFLKDPVSRVLGA